MNDAFRDFEKKEKSREHIGKIIVLTVSFINFLAIALYVVIDFNFLSTILNIVLTIALLCGTDWIRILFASFLGWDAIMMLFGFFSNISDMPWWLIVIYIALIVYTVSASILLFVSRSVKEYLYVRKKRIGEKI